MLYRSESWAVQEHGIIRLERNDARMVRWLCNVNSEDRIDVVEHKNRMQMNNMG